MGLITDTKQERINLRLSNSAKMSLERAARLEGKSVSSFILASALVHAEKTIHDHEIMTLNKQDSDAFFDALSKPITFNKKLSDAFEEHSQRVTQR